MLRGREGRKLICIFHLVFKDDLFDQNHMEYGTFLVGGYKSGDMILNIKFFLYFEYN